MELANLQFSVESRQVDEAGRSLDQLAQKADRAQKATDGLSGGSKRLSGATAQLLASIERTVRELVEIQRAQQQFTMGLAEGAAAAIREAQALDTAAGSMSGYAANTRRAVAAGAQLGGSARLAGHEMVNLGRQLGDVATMAAMGASPLMILSTQGFQIAEVFGVARQRGVTFKDALLDIGRAAGGTVARFGPILAIVGPLAGAFMLWRKHLEDTKAALEATAKAAADFAAVQNTVRDALMSAVEFTEKYKVANAGLTQALDGVLASQSAAYRETMAGIGAMDAASQAAVRRAEVERLATVAILKRAAAEAEARAADSDAAAKKALGPARTSGAWAAMGLAGNPEAIAAGQAVRESEFRRLGGEAARKAAADERAYAKALKEQADALMKANLVMPEATKATKAHGKAARETADAIDVQTIELSEAQRAYEEQIESTDRYIESLIEEARRLTMSAKEFRAYELAKQRALAPTSAQKEQIDLWGNFVNMMKDAREEMEKVKKVELPEPEFDPRGFDAWLDKMDEALRTAEDISWSVQDIFNAFAHNDWMGAMRGLLGAIQSVQKAWKTGSATDKISAVAGVADGIGQAIGGTAGSALSGAASGAMAGVSMGSMLGLTGMAALGPIGIAGAVIGGILGIIGGNKAEKARKAEEERQRQAERARRAEEVARQARELELSLAEATGDVLGALNAQRAAFMEGIAEENRAMAERVYALQQAKQAQEQYNELFLSEQERMVVAAAEVGDGFRSLGLTAVTSMEEFRALADGIDRTTASGQQLFAGLMALGPAFAQVAGFIGSLQGAAAALTPYQAAQGRVQAAQQAVAAAEANLQKAIAAETAANNKAAQAAQKVAQQFRSLADSLGRYRQSLTTGDAARLSPEEAYKQAKAAFDAIQGKTDAESLGKLQEVSEDYRKASEAYYGTSLGYFQDLERIKAAVQLGEKHADKTATAAEQQVAALEAANEALNGIGEGVMGVAEAQKMLALAQEELRLAEEELKREELNLLQQIRDALTNGGGTPGAANDNVWTATGYLAKNADVKAHWDQGIPQKHGFTNEHEWAWSHWTGIGQSEGRKFATGGMFAGGLVNGPTAFPMGLMGEAGPEAIMPLANVGGQLGVRAAGNDNGEIVAELRELRKEVAELRSERARDTKADQAQRAAIYEGTAGLLDGSNERLDTIKRRLAR